MRVFVHALLLGLLLSLTGCMSADKFLGSTEAWYKGGEWSYKSNKNQENFKGEMSHDKDGKPVFKVETTATTPEAAIAAVATAHAESMKLMNEIIKEVLPLIKQGALKAPPANFTTKP